MVNLPSQGEKSRAQRRSKNWQLEAKAVYIWSQCLIKGNYQWQQTAGKWWILHLFLTSDERWTPSGNCQGRSTLRRRNGHAARVEVNVLHDGSLLAQLVSRDAVGKREHPSSAQRQMAHHIPPAQVNRSSHWPYTEYQTPCKYCSEKLEFLIQVSNHYSEVMILSSSLVEPGWLQMSHQRSLRHHSHCILQSSQEC